MSTKTPTPAVVFRDTRNAIRSLYQPVPLDRYRNLLKAVICVLVALAVVLLPELPGLSEAGRWTLGILVLAAGLWITEAIPAFAVGLLIIGLEILILGDPGGVFAGEEETAKWRLFINPWASPLIWLFLGGLILAEAAAKTGLDRTLASKVLQWSGVKPSRVLLSIMGITFVLSMFMSNTATAAMMLAVVAPIMNSLNAADRFRKAVLLGVAFSANLGGMGTIIGTPPNAIAAGFLVKTYEIDFMDWMMVGLPPAMALLALTWLALVKFYPSAGDCIDVENMLKADPSTAPDWQKWLTAAVFLCTVALWMMGELTYASPTSVIAFLPIVVLSAVGVIGTNEMRRLPWDVLILITGGLSLGVAVTETGLAQWLVSRIPLEGLAVGVVALVFAYFTAILSNFMSNTGAANILVPIGFASAAALGVGGAEFVVLVGIALGASAAMCLPIATPPNAIAFSTNQLKSNDFVLVGLIIGLMAPLAAVGWALVMVQWLG